MMDLEGLKLWLPGRTTASLPSPKPPKNSAISNEHRKALALNAGMNALPPFAVTQVGSWPRSDAFSRPCASGAWAG